MNPLRLLFVCTGNICRSPMAEGLARDYALRRGRPLEVRSASAMGLSGHPPDPRAVKVMAQLGIDISGHRSQPLTPELLRWANYVLVMEIRHVAKVREILPEAEDKVLLLGHFGGTLEIPDPVGRWTVHFRRTRDLLRRAVENFIDQLPPPGEEE